MNKLVCKKQLYVASYQFFTKGKKNTHELLISLLTVLLYFFRK